MPSLKAALILTLFCLPIAVVSCNRSSAPAANKLLIYTPHGQAQLRDFIARYQQQYPGTEVQFLDMGSSEILERVRAERNRPQADLWWGAAHTTFQTAAEENLLTSYRPSWSDKVEASTFSVKKF